MRHMPSTVENGRDSNVRKEFYGYHPTNADNYSAIQSQKARCIPLIRYSKIDFTCVLKNRRDKTTPKKAKKRNNNIIQFINVLH